jgi:hypothetical protein
VAASLPARSSAPSQANCSASRSGQDVEAGIASRKRLRRHRGAGIAAFACSAKAPLWQQSASDDLAFGTAILDEIADLLGRHASITWCIEIGSGGCQEQAIAAAQMPWPE